MIRLLCMLASLAVAACGTALPGNSVYQGAWEAFEVNGSFSLGGFDVTDHGEFQLNAGTISGAIAPDGSVSGTLTGNGGACIMSGRCQSTGACSGTFQGDGCPTDNGGAPWTTFTLCRGGSTTC